jgi:hypothetical protein
VASKAKVSTKASDARGSKPVEETVEASETSDASEIGKAFKR